MTGLYTRWALILGATLLLGFLTYQHYQQHLSTISVGTLLGSSPATQPVRIQGMVKSGTLKGDMEQGQATFEFVDGASSLAVVYQGPPLENIRELKTLVLIGRWDSQAQVFRAQETALINNFGFVAAAYLISVLALGWMVFAMSQRVMVLFKEIKESKLYEPEADSLGNKE
ncbi:MAG: cytochrome c maturation protein CcmE [Nitrospirota bacterium]|jgi:cytochrome c-type biogenesis protein CcmE|nr:cytochrome c maturation protein CcmE [Nitrospirota bacterium]MDH4359149.1 cytochrome c maturation protein CcmE [Nitrospirota bacterium]